jgi:carboxypeptidase Taq
MARAQAHARAAWQQARAASDWSLFAPHVVHVFDLKRRAAEYFTYDEHPYDALLEEFEPGMTVAQIRPLFAELKEGLVPLVKAVAATARDAGDACLHQPFDHDRQLAFGVELIQGLGFDMTRGRQDLTAHPFCTSFSPDDVRITTRVDPHFLSPALFGTLHETGHALYEQGVPPELARTPLGSWASLGVHESQSRLWENLVGRSLPFWQRHYSSLQQAFPAQLGDTGLPAFYRAINAVRPSFIRVEADELTYNLHIFLRFDLELALLEERLSVDDLPEAWNQGMRDLLGITPPDDSLGVLQDVHWAIGLVGYFPTYTIGNVLSAQVWDAARRDATIREQTDNGDYAALLAWLRDAIHRHGRIYTPNELVELATGQPPTATPYLDYLRTKFGALYGLT